MVVPSSASFDADGTPAPEREVREEMLIALLGRRGTRILSNLDGLGIGTVTTNGFLIVVRVLRFNLLMYQAPGTSPWQEW